MTDETMRAAFEAWFSSQWPGLAKLGALHRSEKGQYDWNETRNSDLYGECDIDVQWLTWQAARLALEATDGENPFTKLAAAQVSLPTDITRALADNAWRDARRLDWLEGVIDKEGEIHLHDGNHPRGLGLGLFKAKGNARTLRRAIDLAMRTPAPHIPADVSPDSGIGNMGEWRTIDSAPKDGSEVLLGRAASEEQDSDAISVPGYWQEGYEDGVDYMGCDSGFVDSHHQTFSGGRSFGAESHRYVSNQPTHWQPLPTAPAQGGEKME